MVGIAPLAPRLVERVGTKLVVGSGMLIAAAGLAVISTVPVSDGYVRILIGFCLASAGMALTMAPATESIMGSLPPAKAGVGSAMNDTTRQMGGALGVAILGSVFAMVYRPGMAEQLSGLGLSSEQLSRAQDSIGGALQVAAELPAEAAQSISDISKTQFVDGMSTALMVGVAVVLVAAAVVFAFLPARAEDPQRVEGPLDGLASLTYAEAESVLERDAAEARGDLDPAEGGGHGRAEVPLEPAPGVSSP
jgi:hypothetical protein